MDILIHTLSGAAVATAAACLVKDNLSSRFKLVLLGSFAGALPDIDALSMWSGFDNSFGVWLNLNQSGREIYKGINWYSHHAFMHSFLASVVIPVIPILIYAIVKKQKPTTTTWIHCSIFTLSFNAHLLGDLPTPGGSWNGIAYFFPSQDYIGGYGYTWWWNNYDIFILVFTCVIINMISFFVLKRKNYFGTISLLVTISLCFIQLGRRDFDFNSKDISSNIKSEKSLELQRKFLGDRVFNAMQKFDESLPVHF